MTKTLDGIIDNYVHDYGNIKLSRGELKKMLWDFWREQEVISKEEHLDQVCSRIMSYGFREWYLKN